AVVARDSVLVPRYNFSRRWCKSATRSEFIVGVRSPACCGATPRRWARLGNDSAVSDPVTMKLDARSIAAFLAAPDPDVRAGLLYGPDEGKVRERGAELARRVVSDLSDPFRVAEFAGSALADDPARLADEAAAIAMIGGRRVVRVRPAGNECAEAFAQFFKHP